MNRFKSRRNGWLLFMVPMLLLLMTPFTSFGQGNNGSGSDEFEDKTQAFLSAQAQVVGMHNPITSQLESIQPYRTLGLGGQYTFWHSNDVFSLSVNPNANVGLQFSNLGTNLLVQAPVFLMGKVGATATRYNESRFGFGAGLGLNYTYYRTPLAVQLGNGALEKVGEINKNMLAPALALELLGNFGGQVYSIRFNYNLQYVSDELRIAFPGQTPQDVDVEYSNWGIGLAWYIY